MWVNLECRGGLGVACRLVVEELGTSASRHGATRSTRDVAYARASFPPQGRIGGPGQVPRHFFGA